MSKKTKKFSVSVAVMHVPDVGRNANVQAAREALQDWNMTVILDRKREGCWPTAKRAWESALDGDATHHLVLSDDAALCDHFQELLMGAIAARPKGVLSLCYRARPPVDEAVVKRLSWIHSQDGSYGQAIVMPVQYVKDMLDWAERNVRANYEHDDGRVGMWARATLRGIYTPVPQLVRHLEGESLMGHPPARGLGTPLFAADRRDVSWDTGDLEVQGSLFGGRGLRPDAEASVLAAFGESGKALHPVLERMKQKVMAHQRNKAEQGES